MDARTFSILQAFRASRLARSEVSIQDLIERERDPIFSIALHTAAGSKTSEAVDQLNDRRQPGNLS